MSRSAKQVKGSDSLLGRYFLYRMHQISIGEFKLWYVRDREKREVDALITRDNKPWLLVEVKMNDLSVSKYWERFAGLLNCKKIVQIVVAENIYRQVKIGSQSCHLLSAGIFLIWLE